MCHLGGLLEGMVSEADMTVRNEGFSARTDTLCGADKNSIRHSEVVKGRERDRNSREWGRKQWRDLCRQAGWDTYTALQWLWAGLESCLAAFLSLRDKFAIHHPTCCLSVWSETGERLSQRAANLLHVWRDKRSERGLREKMKEESQAFRGTLCIKFRNCVWDINGPQVFEGRLLKLHAPNDRQVDERGRCTLMQPLCAFVSFFGVLDHNTPVLCGAEANCHGKTLRECKNTNVHTCTHSFCLLPCLPDPPTCAHTESCNWDPSLKGRSSDDPQLVLIPRY